MAQRRSDLRDPVGAVRDFNRFYTRTIGVLNEGLLQSPYSLTEARVLFELAHRTSPTASELLRELDLDAGYLSRMLAKFAKRGLLKRVRSASDARQAALHLTPKGRQAFAQINQRSSDEVGRLLQRLPAAGQQRLVAHMHEIRQLLSAAGNGAATPVILREPKPGELGWVVERHGALYAEEFAWDRDFEALVAKIVSEYVQNHVPGKEQCWIAELAGQPVGCVFLVRQDDQVAKLRLLLVEATARGLGIGQQLVAACIAHARKAGYRRIQLWTNDVLKAARKLYERAGFKLVESKPHHSFGHDLVGETWALDLTPE